MQMHMPRGTPGINQLTSVLNLKRSTTTEPANARVKEKFTQPPRLRTSMFTQKGQTARQINQKLQELTKDNFEFKTINIESEQKTNKEKMVAILDMLDPSNCINTEQVKLVQEVRNLMDNYVKLSSQKQNQTKSTIKVKIYLNKSEFAEGAFGKVSLWEPLKTNSKYIIKTPQKDMRVDMEKLKKEVDIANSAGLGSALMDNGIIVQTYAGDSSLDFSKHFDEYKMDPPKTKEDFASDFKSKVKNAIEKLHANGIVHRDIKLANISIQLNTNEEKKITGFDVQIIDFGLSQKDQYTDIPAGTPLMYLNFGLISYNRKDLYDNIKDKATKEVVQELKDSGVDFDKLSKKDQVFEVFKKLDLMVLDNLEKDFLGKL